LDWDHTNSYSRNVCGTVSEPSQQLLTRTPCRV